MTKNVIVVCADEMRADVLNHLGCTAASTPNLDELAKDGISFKNAFCQNPVCTPSRCSFLSGLYPHVNGHRTMTHMIQPHESIILNELKDNNYYVGLMDAMIFFRHSTKVFTKNTVMSLCLICQKNNRIKRLSEVKQEINFIMRT